MRISDWSSDVCSSDLVAAILFTSGSTGVPKGVVYRHRHFVAQIQMLGAALGIAPGAINLPTFPPFALFDPALGSTGVIPDMDPTRSEGHTSEVQSIMRISYTGCRLKTRKHTLHSTAHF